MASAFLFAPAFKYSRVERAQEHRSLGTKKRKRRSDGVSADAQYESVEEDAGHNISAQLSGGDPRMDELGDEPDPSLGDEKSLVDGDLETMAYGSSRPSGPRKQHLAVLIAILHRCLLAGDYVRAGRAWGMLLRTDLNGRPVDLRAHGRWSIGAEILLCRDRQVKNRQQPAVDEEVVESHFTVDQDESIVQSPSMFSQEGFDKAKDYYERLILQYPYRKTMPNATSSLDFYPAMFGLWTYAVQYRHKRAMDSSSPKLSDLSPDHVPTADGDQARRATFQGASEIAARLDELLVSPPYSDHPRLWHLRGMIALWMADLTHVDDPTDPFSDEESSLTSQERPTPDSNLERKPLDQDLRLQQYLDAKARAQQAFDNISKLGTGTVRQADLA